jgi:hypothetical protein
VVPAAPRLRERSRRQRIRAAGGSRSADPAAPSLGCRASPWSDRGPQRQAIRKWRPAVLWFEIDDFDAVIARADEMGAEVVMAPHRNPPDGSGGPNHRECWLRNLDGYVVVIASPDGEAGPYPSRTIHVVPWALTRLRLRSAARGVALDGSTRPEKPSPHTDHPGRGVRRGSRVRPGNRGR